MIRIENVVKTYNSSVCAVDHLNLTVENGEIVGFIGPNGARRKVRIFNQKNMILSGITFLFSSIENSFIRFLQKAFRCSLSSSLYKVL